jgi:CHASE1-domain containing sensor protein
MDAITTNRDDFERIATRRVQQVIDRVDLLSNCSNRNYYEYSEEDVNKMFSELNKALRLAKSKFKNELSRKNKNKFEF